jgi:hypothetical protein
MRKAAAWKVETQSSPAPFTMAFRRAFISSAALLVKVTARISEGKTPRLAMR